MPQKPFLVSVGQTFIQETMLYELQAIIATIDPHKHESYCKQSRNFPYTMFTVLGIAVASSENTEDSSRSSSISQGLSITPLPRWSNHDHKRQ